MGGMPDLSALAGMFGGGAGGGGGGMPDIASLMQNPQLMAMAQQVRRALLSRAMKASTRDSKLTPSSLPSLSCPLFLDDGFWRTRFAHEQPIRTKHVRPVTLPMSSKSLDGSLFFADFAPFPLLSGPSECNPEEERHRCRNS